MADEADTSKEDDEALLRHGYNTTRDVVITNKFKVSKECFLNTNV